MSGAASRATMHTANDAGIGNEANGNAGECMRATRYSGLALALGLIALMVPWAAAAQQPTVPPVPAVGTVAPMVIPTMPVTPVMPVIPGAVATGMTGAGTVTGAAGGTTVTLRDLGYPDTPVTNTLTRQEYAVPGPGGVSRMPATLNFSFSHSAQLDPARSAVRVEWNGLPVYSEALATDSANKVTRAIPIAADRIQPGLNQLSFAFLLLLPDDGLCPEDANPSRVATVFGDTSVDFGVSVAAVRPDLNLGTFPVGFTQVAEPVTRVSVALPQDPTSSELSAAATVAGQIARLAPKNRFTFATIDPAAPLPTDTRIIAIGSPQRNAIVNRVAPTMGFTVSGATFVTPDGTQTARETGFLMLAAVPQNPATAVLVVTGVSEEGITNAARLFGSMQLLRTINGPYAVAQQVTPLPTREGGARVVTLFPQGVPVTRQTDVAQRIVLPPLPDTSSVRVNLTVARSPNLNLDLSYLRFTLNGQPMGTVPLGTVTAQGSPVTLDVPARAFRAGLNTVGFSGVARTPPGQCDSSYANRGGAAVYLTVAPNVTLETQEAARSSAMSLALWPYPLLAQDNRPPTLVAGSDGVNAMLNTAAILGPLQEGDMVSFNALRAGPDDPLPPEGNRIVFGTDDQLPYRAALVRDLPLALENNVYIVRNQAEVAARIAGNTAPGVIELVGTARGRTFIITSTDVAQLDTAVRALSGVLPDTTAAIVNQDAVNAPNPPQRDAATATSPALRVQALTVPGAQVQTGQARLPFSILNVTAAVLGAAAVMVCATIGFLGSRRNA